MKDKARANLKASQLLLKRKLLDPAMSRLYYALFQAGIHAMERAGRTPAGLNLYRKDRWGHDTICGNAYLCRKQKDDELLFREARDLREQADYDKVPVPADSVWDLLPSVELFVEETCR